MTRLARATLTAKTDRRGRELPAGRRRPLEVDFNPEKLDLQITSALEANRNQRNKRQPPQFVTSSTAKLSMELVFDGTTDGGDVRARTFALVAMMMPTPHPDRNNPKRGIPSIVVFEWGSFVFEGYIDSFRESLDFWSASGVPLRSTVSLSLTQQEEPFQPPRPLPRDEAGRDDPVLRVEPGASADSIARELGAPGAADVLARANGVESRRRLEVDALALPSRLSAGAAAGLAAAGSAAADLPEAFAGLRGGAEAQRPRPELDLGADLPAAGGLSASAGIGFGGRAGPSAGAGLTAEVGAEPGAIRIIFEEG